jgi:hypothetical protein
VSQGRVPLSQTESAKDSGHYLSMIEAVQVSRPRMWLTLTNSLIENLSHGSFLKDNALSALTIALRACV